MPFSLSVAISDSPCATLSVLSPLIVMVTLPLGERYFLQISSITTSAMMTIRNIPILAKMNCPIVLLSLKFNTREAHHGYCHKAHGDEGDAKALKRLRHVAVLHFLTDSTHGDYGQCPAQS